MLGFLKKWLYSICILSLKLGIFCSKLICHRTSNTARLYYNLLKSIPHLVSNHVLNRIVCFRRRIHVENQIKEKKKKELLQVQWTDPALIICSIQINLVTACKVKNKWAELYKLDQHIFLIISMLCIFVCMEHASNWNCMVVCERTC